MASTVDKFYRSLGSTVLFTIHAKLDHHCCSHRDRPTCDIITRRLRHCKSTFSGKKIAYGLILATFMIPVQVTFIPMFLMMKEFNWIDTYQALIVPFLGSAFATFWLVQAFRQVPQVILDAAQMDGAGHMWILTRIVLPMCKPSLLSVAFLNFVFHYNDLFWPLITTQSNSMRTVPVGLTYMIANDGSGTSWSTLMASSLLAILPALLLFFIGQKYFVQGTAHTAIKE